MSDPHNYSKLLGPAEAVEPAVAGDLGGDPAAQGLELVRIEVEPDPNRRGDIGAAELLERFSARVDELGAAVVGMAGRLRDSLQAGDDDADRPGPWFMSQVMMEFGLNLEAETGVVVVKGKTAAAIKVAIMWARREPGSGSPS